MPKKRKTRKEKLLKDQKRQTVNELASSVVSSPQTEPQQQKQESNATGMTFSLSQTQTTPPQTPQKEKQAAQTVTVTQNEYGYLGNDLMRTALLTGAIVFAELFIKLFIVH